MTEHRVDDENGGERPAEPLTQLPETLEVELFDTCLGNGLDARDAVDALCDAHPDHADEIRRVAARLEAAALEVPALAELGDERDEADRPLIHPSIPRYRILHEIGRGGFGVVWLAEQTEPVTRLVALKVLLSSAATQSMLQRFQVERQTLATMQHPGIAQILAAGTSPDGQPYFAMEYVDGIAITQYCDRHQLGLNARLRMFRRICSAVAHAHQRGIIHRDLKPGNILVAEAARGEDAQPKIIDFGLAKTLEPLPASELPATDGRLVGTLEYMSPEQASGQPVDVRADVYSLGAVLYELLTGSMPFDPRELRDAGWVSALEIIRYRAPRPPSRLFRDRPSGDVELAAGHRATSVRELARTLRGDLSAIVLTALEKDRDRRYGSIAAFDEDVRRLLADLPVSVGPPSAVYRLRKFTARHRTAVLSATAVLLAVIAGIAVALWSVVEVVRARDVAIEQRNAARYQQYCAQIAVALSALENNDAGRMRDALEHAPEPFRDWEWRFLAARVDQSRQVFDTGAGLARGVQLLDDGRSFAVVSKDEQLGLEAIEVRSLEDGSIRYAVDAPLEVWVRAAGDGVFAACYSNGSVELLRAEDGQPVGPRITLGGRHTVAAFHPTEPLAVIASDRGTLQWIDTASGHRLGEPVHREGHVIQDLAFTPDGRQLVSGGWYGDLVVWDASTHEARAMAESEREFRRLAASRDLLATASVNEDSARLWSLEDGSFLRLLQTDATVTCVAFHPDGASVAVGAFDGSITLFRSIDGVRIGKYHGHDAFVDSVVFTADGAALVSTSWDGTVRVWPPAPRPIQQALATPLAGELRDITTEPTLSRVAALLDPTTLVAAERDGEVLWQRTLERPATRSTLSLVGAAHDVLLRDVDGRLARHDGKTGELRAKTEEAALLRAASRGGDRLATAGSSRQIVVLDGASLEPVAELQFERSPLDAVFLDPRGRRLAVAAGDLYLCDSESGTIERRVELDCAAFLVAVSADDTTLCVVDLLGGVFLHDTMTGERTATLRSTTGSSIDAEFSAAFSPDGNRLATFSRDHVLRIWDTASGDVLLSLPGQPWCQPRFSADGAAIFAVALRPYSPPEVYVWDAPLDAGLGTPR